MIPSRVTVLDIVRIIMAHIREGEWTTGEAIQFVRNDPDFRVEKERGSHQLGLLVMNNLLIFYIYILF